MGLSEGDVLGERFEIRGVLGRGGMATVYLARDRVRDQRVAVKVLHAHLAADPSSRRRLQREVQAAGLIRHEAALVAYELHEVDGVAALSLPFFSGETLAERVVGNRPLDDAALRDLGIRVAEVLALAHRSGVLHRDVTPNNVMIDASDRAVLTDFGLAQVSGGASTKGTAALGTVGYAAPEVYGGKRSDPRSDLYSLGAVLYFGATGSEPFGSDNAMGALQKQLAGEHTPLAELRPDLPSDLVQTIESLLVPDANLRPQGAGDVVAALQRRRAPQQSTGPLPKMGEEYQLQRALPQGRWAVVVKDGENEGRRKVLRVERGRDGQTVESMVHRSLLTLWDGLREMVGLRDGTSPEQRLAASVARVASLPPEALDVPDVLLEPEFRLVDGVDEATARALVKEAKRHGFKANARLDRHRKGAPAGLAQARIPLTVAIWLAFTTLGAIGLESGGVLVFAILATVLIWTVGARNDPAWKALPLAFGANLGDHASEGYEHVVTSDDPELSRGEELVARAHVRLQALQVTVDASDHLPAPAVRDLLRLVQQLAEEAQALGLEVDRLESELANQPDSGGSDAVWLAARRERLQTLSRAGDAVDPDELRRLDEALAAQEAAEQARGRVESGLTAAVAQLLEIAASATRTRLDLLAREKSEAPVLVAALRADAEALSDARRELGERAARGIRQ